MILTVTPNASIDTLYLLDELAPHTVMRVRQVIHTAGGKGLNVSRIAALAGEPVLAMGFAGGFKGRQLEALLRHSPGIQPAFTRTRAETRSCINVWEVDKGLSTEFLEPGQLVRQAEIARFFKDFERHLPQASCVTLSGSLPPGLHRGCYADLIRLCRAAGVPVLLDSSGAALQEGLAARPTLIKPNLAELEQLLGQSVRGEARLHAAALGLHRQGIACVVVSLGAEGALMVCGEGSFMAVPPPIKPVNTVSCGDSMVGGFAVGFARGWTMADSLRYAVAVSAANALTLRNGSYEASDLARLSGQVRLKRV
ncbi:MAG: 1-phosphofructokinase family hexose kinase [Clostridiales bacterium]|nr:1-phosphofructokinase family hexose kinase [Clostridiales bacterium]